MDDSRDREVARSRAQHVHVDGHIVARPDGLRHEPDRQAQRRDGRKPQHEHRRVTLDGARREVPCIASRSVLSHATKNTGKLLAQAACKNADISTRPVATRRASAIDTARGSSLQLLALAAARNRYRRNRLTSM